MSWKVFRHVSVGIDSLAIRTGLPSLNKLGLAKRCAPLASYHTTQRASTVWDKGWVDPVPDRDFYVQNPPVDGDSMYTVNVKAAPTRYYYSVFYDRILEKLEKMILKEGRGDLAYEIANNTLRKIKLIQIEKYHQTSDEEKDKIELNPLVILHEAIQNATPAMGLKSYTKGGASFQVPSPISDKKKFFMTSKWMLTHSRSNRPRTPLSERLAKEILAAYKNEGAAIKKKQDLHRQVLSSKAYMHLRWR